MKRKYKKRRFLSSMLAVIILVSMNINPVAIIAGEIVDSGIVDRFVNLKDNLIYMARNSYLVNAEESDDSSTEIVPPFSGGINATLECDATDAIDDLMGSGNVTMTDLKKALDDDVILIQGTIEEGDEAIITAVGDVNTTLKGLSAQLSQLQNTIKDMQHAYRVAHLYSINNESDKALWRPYTEDVPYVKDFASVSGKFANVYTGYWDSAVTTLTNPAGSAASRPLQILGYDAIVRYEGVVLQRTVSTTQTPNGLSMNSITYNQTDGRQSAYSIATVEREEIGEDEITWLDAVTVLYKALGQEQYTYQSFMSENWSITPETSPAYQGLSNVVPTTEADGSQHYNGYDFRIFLTRSNIVTGTSESAQKIPLYWKKAVSDQFIPAGTDMTGNITGSDFVKLAHKMMVAYGEPEMTMDETMALLQVYGTNFPISLGIEVADAWAYLKVRGCLADDVFTNLSRHMSRYELLDICMRIKDTDSRLDYKTIDVVLDIGELLRDDGYYPVYDLEFSTGEFSTSVEYNYSEMSSYGYCLLMSDDVRLGTTGVIQIFSEPDITKKIEDAELKSQTMEVDGHLAVLFTVPKSYTGNIFIASVNLADEKVVHGAVDFIEVPAKLLGGGLFFGSYQISSNVATVTDSMYHGFDHQSADKRFHPYADFERAKEERPTPSVAASNATILERWELAWNTMTSPMVAHAAESSNITENALGGGGGGVSVNYTSTKNRQAVGAFRYVDSVGHSDADILHSSVPDGFVIENIANNPQSDKNGVYIADDLKTVYLNRLYLATKYTLFKNAILNYVDSGAPHILLPDSVLLTAYTRNSGEATENPRDSEGVAWNNVYTLRDAIRDHTNRKYETITGKYEYQYYDDLLISWLLSAAPTGSRFEYDKDVSSSPVTYNDSYIVSSAKYSAGDETTKNLLEMLQNQRDNKDYAQVSEDIKTALYTSKLTKVDYAPGTNTFTLIFDDHNSGAGAVMDIIGVYDSMSSFGSASNSEFIDIGRNVASSAVMSRDEEKMFSWTSLKEAGIVQPLVGDSYPTVNQDGSYFFMTKDGLVKVNPTLSTIQIGTTLYDMASSDGSKGPALIYIDNKDGQNGEMYIDVRCVMGLIAQDFVRNEEKTTELRNSIGAQDYVVYDIGSEGVSSALFEAVAVNCFNFPDIQGISNWTDGSIGSGYYDVKVYKSTIYDDRYDIGNGTNYWDSSKASSYTRIGLSSFVPTANWLTVIDDNGEDVNASLFVYYPIAPFEYGFADTGGESQDNLTQVREPTNVRYDDYLSAVQDTGSTDLMNALNAAYPESMRDKWYVQMTYKSAASLFNMTGKYYLSSDFVIREFRIKYNVYNFVEAYDEFSGSTTTSSSDGVNVITYTEQANAPGAVYWLDGIGFVYNTPSVEEFSLSKYLSGEYPLPIATDTSGKYKTPGIINYNMNYWGTWVDSSGGVKDAVPYGYTLSHDGYIHYKASRSDSPYVKWSDLPARTAGNAGDKMILPFMIKGQDGSVTGHTLSLAPCGVYFYFGGNTLENAPPSTLTKTVTQLNQFYYGSNRVTMYGLDEGSSALFNIVSTRYNPIKVDSKSMFYRVYRDSSHDILINNGVVSVGSTNSISEVIIDDYVTDLIESPISNMGSTNLIRAIDEGSSFAIVLAFTVMPMIGIILMMVLVGLSFISDVRVVQLICEKTIDPVRILTWGHRDIHTWTWNKVLFPCILLFCLFALFLNGNIVRIVQYTAEWYGVISKYVKNMW